MFHALRVIPQEFPVGSEPTNAAALALPHEQPFRERVRVAAQAFGSGDLAAQTLVVAQSNLDSEIVAWAKKYRESAIYQACAIFGMMAGVVASVSAIVTSSIPLSLLIVPLISVSYWGFWSEEFSPSAQLAKAMKYSKFHPLELLKTLALEWEKVSMSPGLRNLLDFAGRSSSMGMTSFLVRVGAELGEADQRTLLRLVDGLREVHESRSGTGLHQVELDGEDEELLARLGEMLTVGDVVRVRRASPTVGNSQ